MVLEFLTRCHADPEGDERIWGYNKEGMHPLHTLILCMRKHNHFPDYKEFVGLPTLNSSWTPNELYALDLLTRVA